MDDAESTEPEAAEPESVELIDLTDEELAAIDTRPPEERLVVYPFLNQLSEEEWQTAVIVAFRGLAARGYVVGPDADDLQRAAAEPDKKATVGIQMNEALRRLLELRSTAAQAVVSQRTIGDQQDFYYLYLLGDDGVLAELVEPMGLHRFRVYEKKEAAGLLVGYLNPMGIEGSDGDTELIDAAKAADGAAPPELVARLGAAKSFSEFFVRHFDQAEQRPPLTGIFAGDDGLHLMKARYDSAEPVAVTAVSAETLRAQIEEALA